MIPTILLGAGVSRILPTNGPIGKSRLAKLLSDIIITIAKL